MNRYDFFRIMVLPDHVIEVITTSPAKRCTCYYLFTSIADTSLQLGTREKERETFCDSYVFEKNYLTNKGVM